MALRGSGRLASAPASASSRLRGRAVTACCPRPRPGSLQQRLCRLPGARGWTPPSSGSPRPFPLPHRKAKTIGAAQAREGNGKQEGRRRREVTLASVSGLPGLPPGSQSACAERGRGGHPASGVAWKKRFPKFSSAPLGLLCSSSCSSLRCLPEIQTLAGLARVGGTSTTPRDVEVRGEGLGSVSLVPAFNAFGRSVC